MTVSTGMRFCHKSGLLIYCPNRTPLWFLLTSAIPLSSARGFSFLQWIISWIFHRCLISRAWSDILSTAMPHLDFSFPWFLRNREAQSGHRSLRMDQIVMYLSPVPPGQLRLIPRLHHWFPEGLEGLFETHPVMWYPSTFLDPRRPNMAYNSTNSPTRMWMTKSWKIGLVVSIDHNKMVQTHGDYYRYLRGVQTLLPVSAIDSQML